MVLLRVERKEFGNWWTKEGMKEARIGYNGNSLKEKQAGRFS